MKIKTLILATLTALAALPAVATASKTVTLSDGQGALVLSQNGTDENYISGSSLDKDGAIKVEVSSYFVGRMLVQTEANKCLVVTSRLVALKGFNAGKLTVQLPEVETVGAIASCAAAL